jgi:retron-type reverse transcriptase
MMTYTEICSFPALYTAYKRARLGKRKRAATAQYEANALFATERLSYILATRKYEPSKFETFYVYEPKKRLVQAPAFVDKVVQHSLVDNYLYEAITRSFIRDSHATQIGKGTHVGLDRLTHHMREYFQKRKGHDETARREAGLPYRPMAEWDYAQGWVLKADVRKFFASIDHGIVKDMLRKKVTDEGVYDLMCTYIDHTPAGLPLGYQTSQLLALMYLDAFDHWIKERLGVKYYGRYMDDFYLIHEDKEYLRYCLREIKTYLSGLKLELNEKTGIFPLRNGIDFLGFHSYLTETGKVVRKLRQSAKKRMNSRIKKWKREQNDGTLDLDHVLASYTAWDAHAAHGDTRELRKKIRGIMGDNFKEVNKNGNNTTRQ